MPTAPDLTSLGTVLAGISEEIAEIPGGKFIKQPDTTVLFHSYNSDFDKSLEGRIEEDDKLRRVVELVEKNEESWEKKHGSGSKYCITIGRKKILNSDYVQSLVETYKQASKITDFSDCFFAKLIKSKSGMPYSTIYTNLFVFTDTERHKKANQKKRDKYNKLKEKDPKKYKNIIEKNRKQTRAYRENINKDQKRREENLEQQKEWFREWYKELKEKHPEEYKKYREKYKERYNNFCQELKEKKPQQYEKFREEKRKATEEWHKKRKERIEVLERRIEDIRNEVITIYDLCKAIAHKHGKRRFRQYMGEANIIMDYSWPDDRILDNRLDLEDRQLFYMLEDIGLIIKERADMVISGTINDPSFRREWLAFSWILWKEEILNAELKYERWCGPKKVIKKDYGVCKDYSIYESDEIWKRNMS